MHHYPTEEQVKNAIEVVWERGDPVTDVSVATEIGARCGLTPGADVVASLIRHFGLLEHFYYRARVPKEHAQNGC